jgi:hypothetical protein
LAPGYAYLLEVIFFLHALWYPDSEVAAITPQPTALPNAKVRFGMKKTFCISWLQAIGSKSRIPWRRLANESRVRIS